MKKVRSVINVVLGSIITALGLSGCERAVMYAPDPNLEVLYGPAPIDTTVHCMYGVTAPEFVMSPAVDEETENTEEINN